MIGRYFYLMLGFLRDVLAIDFGIGVDLGAIIFAFFTLIAFIRFFIKPILGGKLSSDSSGRSSKKEG